jgi:hypothetical protein
MLEITLQDLDPTLHKIALLCDTGARRGIRSAAMRTKQYIITDLIPKEPRPPVDRRQYEAGWKLTPIPDGMLLSNSVPHASLVEYGVKNTRVRISRMMIQNLMAWAKRKGIGEKVKKYRSREGEAKQRVVKATEAKLRRIAFGIAIGMKRYGIFNHGKGLQIFKRAVDKAPQFIIEEVTREIFRV